MPELPEVETTVRALNNKVKNLKIIDVWSSYNSLFHKGKQNIKDPDYFKSFRKKLLNKKILNVSRRAKNILIDIEGNITILVHMKMTGHFLYGKYKKLNKDKWLPYDEKSALNDMPNRFIRLIFKLSNNNDLAFSDMRKFAKVCYFNSEEKNSFTELKKLGPEPLSKDFSPKTLEESLMRKPNGKIKQVFMNPEIISGIGNIYSDEILWYSGVHPLSNPKKIPKNLWLTLYKNTKKILEISIKTGGDSMSDFRMIDGTKGGFQNFHKAYRKTGLKCQKSGCQGVIERIKVGGRSTHFCPIHQKLFR